VLARGIAAVVAGSVVVWFATSSGVAPEPSEATVSPPRKLESPQGAPDVVIATPPTTTSAAAELAGPPVSAVVQVAERAAAPGMNLGVAVLDVSSGELVEGSNARRQVYSASLAKLIVVVDMVDRRRSNGLTITASDVDLVGRALRGSDDGAMNVLWGRFDGQGAIGRVATRLGLTDTEAPDDSTQWGETLVTATDFTKIYQHILADLTPEDRQLITGPLASAQHIAVDGFDQYFGLLLHGASAQIYAKQGWVNYRPSTVYLHSAGVVHSDRTGRDYAVALLSQQSASNQTARTRLSTVAAAALGALGAG
jgi:hypothetical protein